MRGAFRFTLFLGWWALSAYAQTYYVHIETSLVLCTYDGVDSDSCNEVINLHPISRSGGLAAYNDKELTGRALDLVHLADGTMKVLLGCATGPLLSWAVGPDYSVDNGKVEGVFPMWIWALSVTWDATHSTPTYMVIYDMLHMESSSFPTICGESACIDAVNSVWKNGHHQFFLEPEDSDMSQKTIWIVDTVRYMEGGVWKCEWDTACVALLTVGASQAETSEDQVYGVSAVYPEYDAGGTFTSLMVLEDGCQRIRRAATDGSSSTVLFYSPSSGCPLPTNGVSGSVPLQPWGADVERVGGPGSKSETVAYWIVDESDVIRCEIGGTCATRTHGWLTNLRAIRVAWSVYYYAQTRNGLVYKCTTESNACAIWLDQSGIVSLIPTLSAFYPTIVHLDQEEDGTTRAIVIGTSYGDVISCDTTASACTLVGSVDAAVTGLRSTWDSGRAVSQYVVATSLGSKVLSSDGSGSITSVGSWALARSAFFLVSPESDSSDIITCTSRKRVERCPYSVDGKPSDCIMLVRGKCSAIAPEYNATGHLSGFAVLFKNRLETCEVHGTNCQVVDGQANGKTGTGDSQLKNPTDVAVERVGTRGNSVAYWILDAGNSRFKRCEVAGDCAIYTGISADALAVQANTTHSQVVGAGSLSTASMQASLEVVVENSDIFTEQVTENSDQWLAVEETLGSVTGEDGWSLESVEMIGDSGARRLAAELTYELTFKLNYVVGTRTISDMSTLLGLVADSFEESVNEQVGLGNWTIIDVPYAKLEDSATDEQEELGQSVIATESDYDSALPSPRLGPFLFFFLSFPLLAFALVLADN